MKKKWFGMLFALCLCLGLTTQAEADWYKPEGLNYSFYYSVTPYDTVTITGLGGTPDADGVVIPEKINDMPVTVIGGAAFANDTYAVPITLPDSITVIEKRAFQNSKYAGILDLPKSLTDIGESAFDNSTGFSEVVFPEGLKSIGASAFRKCIGLSGDLTIPDSVEYIGEKAFYCCSGFDGALKLPRLTEIKKDVFYGCSGFTGKLIIPDGVRSIGYMAFSGCAGFSGQLDLPESLQVIENSAFNGCSGLTGDLVIPDNVYSVGSSVFTNCSGLTGKVVIGKSVMELGSPLVSGATMDGGIVVKWAREGLNLYDLAGTVQGDIVIEAGDIPDKMFFLSVSYSIKNPHKVIIKDKVTSIGSEAFRQVTLEGDLIIPENVKRIGEYAFAGGTGDVDKIVIEGNNLVIEDNAFYQNTSSIGSLTIGDGVTRIGDSAFYGCTGLNGELVVGDDVREIGNYAFGDCTGLTGLTLSKTLETIGDSAFYRCSGLTGELLLPETLISIGQKAFAECTGLTGSLTIPDRVVTMGYQAFYACSGFTGDLTIGDSVEAIPNQAFWRCIGFDGTLTLGRQVKTIGEYAFCGTGFGSSFPNGRQPVLYLPAGLSRIEKSAFDWGKSLDNTSSHRSKFLELYIPASVTYIDDSYGDILASTVYYSGTKSLRSYYNLGVYSDTELYYATWHYVDAVEPTAVSIRGTVTTAVGHTTKLQAVVSPSNVSNAKVTWSGSDDAIATVDANGTVTGVSEGTMTVTAKTVNGLSAQVNVTVTKGTHQILVYATPDGNPLNRAPLAGAKVTIYGVSKTTDANGLAEFKEEEIPNYFSPINISCDGYFDLNDNVYFAEGFANSFTMTGKGDKIYITQADMRCENEALNLLSSRQVCCIPKMNGNQVDDTLYPITVGVDWNIYDEGEIFLFGVKNGRRVYLHRGTNFISLAEYFDVNEQIKLIAQTKNDAGERIRHEVDIPLRLYLDVEIIVPATEDVSTGGKKGIYFLEYLETGLDLGKIDDWASDITLKNGVLTVKFDLEDEAGMKEVTLFKGKLDGKQGPKVTLGGTLSIPIANMNESWKGGFTVALEERTDPDDIVFENVDEKMKKKLVELFGLSTNVKAGVVNIVITSEVRAGIEATLTANGSFDDIGFGGSMTGYGKFSVAAGPGITIDGGDKLSNEDNTTIAIQIKGALDIEMPAEYTYSILDPQKQKISFNPTIEGSVNGVVILQTQWTPDLEGELKLGAVRWNKEKGAEWYSVTSGWQDFEQASTLSLGRSLERGPVQVYQNIPVTANADVALVNGVPHLFFTAKDDTGELCLYDAAWGGLGWGEPVRVSEDNTADFAPDADDGFLVWEDHNGMIPDEVGLTGMLSMTEITAGVLGEDGYETTRLTNDTAYDHTAKVKSADGKALVAWLSSDLADFNGNLNSIYNDSSVSYAIYDGNAWSEVTTVSDIGYVTNLNVTLDGENGTICYKDHTGAFFTIPVDLTSGEQASTSQQEDVGRYAVASMNGEQLLAWFDSEQKLHIQQGGEEAAVLETNFTAVENPVITAVGETAWIFWLEHEGIFYATNAGDEWSGRMCLVKDDAMIRNLACQSVDAEHYVVSYLRTYVDAEGEQTTDLMTLYAEHGTDLWVLDVSAEEETYTDRGTVDYTIWVYNHGEETVTNATVSFYEGDTCVYTEEIKEVISSGSFGELEGRFSPADGSSIHDYSIVVETDGDFRSANNSGSLSVGSVNGGIVDAMFTTDGQENDVLSVLISSEGSAPVTGASLVVRQESADGEILLQKELGELAGGRMEEILLALEPVTGELYYVALEMDETDANPYDDWKLLAVEETVVLNELPACSSELSEDGILNVALNPLDMDMESGIVSVSVYDKAGKMTDITWETMRDTGFADGQMTAQVDLNGVSAGSTVKIIVLDGKTLMPVCEAQTVEI